MRKHCSDVCKLRPCLNKESKNSARLRTIVTAALQRQYKQTELIFWISLVLLILNPVQNHRTRSPSQNDPTFESLLQLQWKVIARIQPAET